MNEAQEYLLDHGLDDKTISRPVKNDPRTWVYASDAMMGFKCAAESAMVHTRKIDIEPRPAPRMTYQGRFSDKAQEYLEWQGLCRILLVRAFKDAEIDQDATIRVSAEFMCKKKRGVLPDLDNLIKALLDALQDRKVGREKITAERGVIHDDRQVAEYGHMKRSLPKGQKCKTNKPYIIVSIEEI
ncbi:MAG: RusA family crossover junction endodeoxyribonuclease [Halobacteriota archaeon]|nr:RusA family crossover junction endodeoxyribonuclease [Halobacteriota archaeon]